MNYYQVVLTIMAFRLMEITVEAVIQGWKEYKKHETHTSPQGK